MALFASSSSTPSPLRQHAQHRSPMFTAIPENDEKEEEEDDDDGLCPPPAPAKFTPVVKRVPTKARKVSGDVGGDWCVTCNICRPSSRDKISIVPIVDSNSGEKHHHSSSSSHSISPVAGLRSLFLSLTRRTPPSSSSSSSSAMAELSRKLLIATRKRDEALLETSRLKTSMAEMESKLARLQSHCEELKSAIAPAIFPDIDTFIAAVSDCRSAVRCLARSILRRPETLRRVSSLLGVPAAHCRNPRALAVFVEALLAGVFYGEFELAAAPEEPLDPAARCETNRAAASAARGIRWEDVVGKGTRCYSEGLSRFCDRRLGEVVEMMGVGVPPTWPEGMLRVWVLRLMARSVHPAVPVLRVAKGASFEPAFMEDVVAGGGAPAVVRMMVAPGFYVGGCGGGGVVKCKVLCVYRNTVTAAASSGE